MIIAAIPPIGESPSSLSNIDNAETSIVASCDRICSSLIESLYLTSIVISCLPSSETPSKSIGMLNGTGLSGSISSMYCVDSIMLESPLGFSVTNPNNPSLFPSLRISPITVCYPDKSITLTP